MRILKQSQFSMPNIFNEILSIYCFGNISVTLIFDLLFVQSAINFCAPTLLRVENEKKIKRIEKQYRIWSNRLSFQWKHKKCKRIYPQLHFIYFISFLVSFFFCQSFFISILHFSFNFIILCIRLCDSIVFLFLSSVRCYCVVYLFSKLCRFLNWFMVLISTIVANNTIHKSK